MLVRRAPAKVNLFLHITGKRADGYHLLESLFVFTEFADKLSFSPAKDITLNVTGLRAGMLAGDNLVSRAAILLQSESGTREGAAITLEKNIPIGAGLGGGSADAAACLLGLAELWGINDEKLLMKAAEKLGADVPACLSSQPQFVQGVGEKLTEVNIAGAPLWLLLVNPNTHLLTADVFKAYQPHFTTPQAFPTGIDAESLPALLGFKSNDLEKPAISLMPKISEILQALQQLDGCRLARMSGSGATCFGLFDTEKAAEAAEHEIAANHANWWHKTTNIITKAV